MQRGFPLELLGLIRCSADGGELRTTSGVIGAFIPEGAVRCVRCGRIYDIWNGVLSLLDARQLHPESTCEMRARDLRNEAILDGTQGEWSSRAIDAIEVQPTLEALGTTEGKDVCELGCGPGRYTVALARAAAAVVAVDVSLSGLMVLRKKLEPTARVALVQADITGPYAASRGFHRVLSTLHSNLPDREHRAASLRQVARMLRDDGRAVVSMHHYSMRDAIARVPASGRYPDSGIYRYFMTTRESRAEASPFFARLKHVHICVSIPGIRNVAMSKVAARIPLMRSGLGRLFLAIGERPRRAQAEGMSQCA